jgi:hypothetical protein
MKGGINLVFTRVVNHWVIVHGTTAIESPGQDKGH